MRDAQFRPPPNETREHVEHRRAAPQPAIMGASFASLPNLHAVTFHGRARESGTPQLRLTGAVQVVRTRYLRGATPVLRSGDVASRFAASELAELSALTKTSK